MPPADSCEVGLSLIWCKIWNLPLRCSMQHTPRHFSQGACGDFGGAASVASTAMACDVSFASPHRPSFYQQVLRLDTSYLSRTSWRVKREQWVNWVARFQNQLRRSWFRLFKPYCCPCACAYFVGHFLGLISMEAKGPASTFGGSQSETHPKFKPSLGQSGQIGPDSEENDVFVGQT